MRAYVCLFDHPVYQALYETLRYVDGMDARRLENFWQLLHVSYAGETFHFQNLRIRLSPDNLYVLNSPVMCLESWRVLLHRAPALIV